MITIPQLKALVDGADKLVDSVSYDVAGHHGRGGNGGLVSNDTIRACDELRVVLNRLRPTLFDDRGNPL